MIFKNAIVEWREVAPWRELRFVEQDMILSRALILIFSDEYLSTKLAFRGGTAIHKLYLKPQMRYSEDIDLVQIDSEPIGKVLDRIRSVMEFLDKPRIKQKKSNNTLLYSYNVEEPQGVISKLKIEINCREHFSVYGLVKCSFSMKNQWFTGECDILTYRFNELIGTKLRALYQRKKGRDLFDVYVAVKSGMLNTTETIECYKKYMDFLGNRIPTATEYIENLENKLTDPNFRSDLTPFFAQNIDYNVDEAYYAVKEHILDFL